MVWRFGNGIHLVRPLVERRFCHLFCRAGGPTLRRRDAVSTITCRQAAETYFNFEKKTRIPIHDTETEDLFKLLNANNYQKGAWVLHMLRHELGDENFFRGIRNYYDAHRGSLASTEDLRAALEQASGKNLQEFFARWVYGAGHPSYELVVELDG